MSENRACPYCAEQIKRKAKVCRYCGKDVTPLYVDNMEANTQINLIMENRERGLNYAEIAESLNSAGQVRLNDGAAWDEAMVKEIYESFSGISKDEIIKTKSEPKESSYTWLIVIGSVVVLAILGSFMDGGSSSSSKAPSQSAKKYTAGLVSESFVCKAATAEHMGRTVKTMSSSKVGGKYHITYRRPSDNSKWGFYCWLQGNRVLWQTDGTNGTGSNGKPGRVRNGQWDEVITYSVKPNKLTINIKYSDGSKTAQVYKIPKNG